MLNIAAAAFQDPGKLLLSRDATRDTVLAEIDAASRQLGSNDIFMISFSGHGGQIPDDHADAANKMDQTWCLYDGQLIDRELYARWSRFSKGVRILVFSDSCHSEGITKVMIMALERARSENAAAHVTTLVQQMREFDRLRASQRRRQMNVKSLSAELSWKVYGQEKARYDSLIASIPTPRFPIDPMVLSISACGDNETAGDAGDLRNSVFTRALKIVWDGGRFADDYIQFQLQIADVAATIRPEQNAARRMIDTDVPSYWSQRPFTVEPLP
jgi:hypothetical protein